MVIYLDQVILLNGLVDYLLLSVCGSVTEVPLRRPRLLLASCFGGIYAAATLVPGLRRLGSPPGYLAFGGALCALAFGTGRGILRRWAVLLLLAAAFSGIVLVLTEVFRAPASLVGRRVYYPVSLGTLVLTAGGSYGAMRWALGRFRHQGGDIARVRVTLAGRTCVFTALRDTGNTLRDPITGVPVLVAEGALLEELLPELACGEELLKTPMDLLEPIRRRWPETRPGLIPYRAVGVEQGLLLTLRPGDVEIDGKSQRILLAFSPGALSDGGGYRALLGGEL